MYFTQYMHTKHCTLSISNLTFGQTHAAKSESTFRTQDTGNLLTCEISMILFPF